MTAAAPDRVEHVTGLYVGVFTAPIAPGAFVGGTVVDTAGVTPLLWGALAAVSPPAALVTAPVLVLSVALTLLARRWARVPRRGGRTLLRRRLHGYLPRQQHPHRDL
jgi:predicted MFS family arabinose efflux permease